jgi:hypothetical protein
MRSGTRVLASVQQCAQAGTEEDADLVSGDDQAAVLVFAGRREAPRLISSEPSSMAPRAQAVRSRTIGGRAGGITLGLYADPHAIRPRRRIQERIVAERQSATRCFRRTLSF